MNMTFNRSKFGSELLIIHLVMSQENVRERLEARHFIDKYTTDILMVKYTKRQQEGCLKIFLIGHKQALHT